MLLPLQMMIMMITTLYLSYSIHLLLLLLIDLLFATFCDLPAVMAAAVAVRAV